MTGPMCKEVNRMEAESYHTFSNNCYNDMHAQPEGHSTYYSNCSRHTWFMHSLLGEILNGFSAESLSFFFKFGLSGEGETVDLQ